MTINIMHKSILNESSMAFHNHFFRNFYYIIYLIKVVVDPIAEAEVTVKGDTITTIEENEQLFLEKLPVRKLM